MEVSQFGPIWPSLYASRSGQTSKSLIAFRWVDLIHTIAMGGRVDICSNVQERRSLPEAGRFETETA